MVCFYPLFSSQHFPLVPKTFHLLSFKREEEEKFIRDFMHHYGENFKDQKVLFVMEKKFFPEILNHQGKEEEKTLQDKFFSTGTLGKILQVEELPEGSYKLLLETDCGFSLDYVQKNPSTSFLEATGRPIEPLVQDEDRCMALKTALLQGLRDYKKYCKPEESSIIERFLQDQETFSLGDFLFTLSTHLPLRFYHRYNLLKSSSLDHGFDFLFKALQHLLRQGSFEQSFLKILKDTVGQQESGDIVFLKKTFPSTPSSQKDDSLEAYEDFLRRPDIGKKVKKAFGEKLKHYENTLEHSSEKSNLKRWLDFVLELPFGESLAPISLDMSHVQRVMDEDLEGLEKVKNAILRFQGTQIRRYAQEQEKRENLKKEQEKAKKRNGRVESTGCFFTLKTHENEDIMMKHHVSQEVEDKDTIMKDIIKDCVSHEEHGEDAILKNPECQKEHREENKGSNKGAQGTNSGHTQEGEKNSGEEEGLDFDPQVSTDFLKKKKQASYTHGGDSYFFPQGFRHFLEEGREHQEDSLDYQYHDDEENGFGDYTSSPSLEEDTMNPYHETKKPSYQKSPPILVLCGPPGTGKTALVKAIGRALGLPIELMSLAGKGDPSYLQGHGYTYVGSTWGAFANGLKNAGVRNPIFFLDEIDKFNPHHHHGSLENVLVAAMDPEQNKEFLDQYLNFPLDLSEVFFICTANSLDSFHGPLRSRMEVISVPSYTPREKLKISLQRLWPKALEESFVDTQDLSITPQAMERLIEGGPQEGGVRKIKQMMKALIAQWALEKQQGKKISSLITLKNLYGLMKKAGYPLRLRPLPLQEDRQGLSMGLAWTSVGGDVMPLETILVPQEGSLKLTGRLGDVMKESAQLALSWSSLQGKKHYDYLKKTLDTLDLLEKILQKESLSQENHCYNVHELELEQKINKQSYVVGSDFRPSESDLRPSESDLRPSESDLRFSSFGKNISTPLSFEQNSESLDAKNHVGHEEDIRNLLKDHGLLDNFSLSSLRELQGSMKKAFSSIPWGLIDQWSHPKEKPSFHWHLHAPDGAVPKDGPSAGVTMTLSLMSWYLGLPVKSDVAMTGEIDLLGYVLPVGGIREKVIGAYTKGMKTVLLPGENVQDIEDIPPEVRKNLSLVFVHHLDDVLKEGLKDYEKIYSPLYDKEEAQKRKTQWIQTYGHFSF